jgi:hypothetical protein
MIVLYKGWVSHEEFFLLCGLGLRVKNQLSTAYRLSARYSSASRVERKMAGKLYNPEELYTKLDQQE